MKKILIFLFSIALLCGPFITPAAALENNDFAFSSIAYFNAPILSGTGENKQNLTTTLYFDNLNHINTFTDLISSANYGIYITSERLRSDTGQYFTTLDWAISSQISDPSADISLPVFSHIYFNDVSYPLTYSNNKYTADFDNINFQMSVHANGDTITFQAIILFRYYYESGTLFLPIDMSIIPGYATNDNGAYNFIGYTPTIVSVYDMSNADIVAAINAMANSSSNTTNNVITAITQAGSSISQTQVTTSQGVVTSVNQVQATTEQVKQAVQIMEENMSDNVASGLEEYDKREEEKLTEELDGNVQDIIDKLPLLDQQDNFVNATDSIINAFSDTSMDCNFTVPAGVVTLSGTTYTFWEEQEVDLNSWFNNQYIQLLLVGFRFLIGFGMLYYMIEWINKIISLVLLEDTGLSAQEWRSEYREGVRARGYKKR